MGSIRLLFPVFLLVNLLMLPAILLHGGHHLIDVFGGFSVFALSLVATNAILRRQDSAKPVSAATSHHA